MIIRAVSIVMLVCVGTGLGVGRADDLTDQVVDNKKQIIILESKIADQQRKIEQLKLQESNIENQIELLDAEKDQTQLELDAAQMQLDQVTADIDGVTAQIDQTQKDLDLQVEIFKEHVNDTYILSRTSALDVLVEAKTMADYVRRLEYQEVMDDQNNLILADLNTIKENLTEQKQSLDEKRSQLEEMKAQVVAKQAELDEQIATKEALLSQTRGLQANYQNIIDANVRAKNEIDSQIRSIEAEIARKAEEARQNAIDNGTDPGPATPSRAGFIWPVKGTITMNFWESYPDWMLRVYSWLNNGNARYHTGIDIAAPSGSTIKAPKAGEVVLVRDFGSSGYGKCVMIDHNGVISLYGHMSSISVFLGQEVDQGDTVGAVGSSGFSTGAHLHLEFREKGKLVDPLSYLP